jgi:hypothetical protein
MTRTYSPSTLAAEVSMGGTVWASSNVNGTAHLRRPAMSSTPGDTAYQTAAIDPDVDSNADGSAIRWNRSNVS